jgi:uncharacterized protein YqfA (UPF0365 family)
MAEIASAGAKERHARTTPAEREVTAKAMSERAKVVRLVSRVFRELAAIGSA